MVSDAEHVCRCPSDQPECRAAAKKEPYSSEGGGRSQVEAGKGLPLESLKFTPGDRFRWSHAARVVEGSPAICREIMAFEVTISVL
jgi:hypothetical protein